MSRSLSELCSPWDNLADSKTESLEPRSKWRRDMSSPAPEEIYFILYCFQSGAFRSRNYHIKPGMAAWNILEFSGTVCSWISNICTSLIFYLKSKVYLNKKNLCSENYAKYCKPSWMRNIANCCCMFVDECKPDFPIENTSTGLEKKCHDLWCLMWFELKHFTHL